MKAFKYVTANKYRTQNTIEHLITINHLQFHQTPALNNP